MVLVVVYLNVFFVIFVVVSRKMNLMLKTPPMN